MIKKNNNVTSLFDILRVRFPSHYHY